MIIVTIATSLILGVLLRHRGVLYSEISFRDKLALLTVLAIGVGLVIFTLVLHSSWLPYFIIIGIAVLCFDLLILFYKFPRKTRDISSV
jgi:hypothetical protein